VPARAAVVAALIAAACVVSIAAAPASAAPSTRAGRVAAANAFAHRTLTFGRARDAAQDDALRALAARRAAAQDCLGVWQSAPVVWRGDLGLLYFEHLSGGLWSVDARLFRGWITDLRRSPRIDRSPVLARAADALRRQYLVANTIYTAVPDACTTVTRWRDAGWTDVARPAILEAIDKLVDAPADPDGTLIAAGARQLARYARVGEAAAGVLQVGVDEPDSLVESHTGCDAVGALVLPKSYAPCTS
jgi:hypothetical protein